MKKRSTKTHNTLRFTVQQPCDLLSYIMQCLQGISRTRAKAILAGQGVMVNTMRQTQHDFALTPGMVVTISKHKRGEGLQNPLVSIVYEDRWIVVVHKGTGITSTEANPTRNSVKKILDDYYRNAGKPFTVHVVHRLDRDTSGLMVYAKSTAVRKQMEDQWQDLVLDRRYVALVEGIVEQEHDTIASWLLDTPSMKVVSSHTDNGGKHAVTEYWRIQHSRNFTLLEVKLHTGRKNQIRVHLGDIGHPIAGDAKYGSTKNPIKRLALHAFILDLIHPVTRETLRFELPCPPRFIELSQPVM